ncbi:MULTISPECIES: dodecin [Crateriforma]|uniref:Dodecin n=1 Tax=Crateriforma conspicua TaxID=2527996 RepID=A0A5C5YBT8_9PLAN|nr:MULTISPECIES: dodecin [Crateriforma]QDV61298.1 hypothetical protein Mal65_04210 [Crateriforma conspicua]TWT72449.1 hypothetical protein Pan14r_47690 [Crateriforma conspicua]TWU63314.1 hypothetical protein V7x_50540 [Crateriforma conspicua]
MSHHTYKKIEVTGTSPVSIEEAVETAITHASRTVRGLSWFELTETRGLIEEGKVSEWQVTIKIGFNLDQ